MVIFILIVFFIILYYFNNKDNFISNIEQDKITIYNFNTNWCGYSRQFQPIWDKFVVSVTDSKYKMIDMKCDNQTDEITNLMKKYNIEGFPTIIIDNGKTFVKYNGPRTINGLRQGIGLNNIETTQEIIDKNITCNGNPQKQTIIYNFNTSWCGYSTRFQPIWDEFARKATTNTLSIIDIKCDDSKNNALCNSFDIPGFPTIIKVSSNGNKEEYKGPRTIESLINFVK